MEIRIRLPIRSGNTFGNQGPQAKIVMAAPSASPPSMATSSSREPLRRPNDARPIRMEPPSSSKTRATDSIARRARTTPAAGS